MLGLLLVGVLGFKVHVGLAAFAASTLLIIFRFANEKKAFQEMPWSVVLMVCGAWLVWEARSGGYREMDAPSGAEQGDWHAVAWVIAGVVANAALITTLGFILACALCFALAVRGLRIAEGKAGGSLKRGLLDLLTGVCIAAPVFWLFTKLLAINLPGLTASGWL
jgi:putative tricarboxylic transport membrane protein